MERWRLRQSAAHRRTDSLPEVVIEEALAYILPYHGESCYGPEQAQGPWIVPVAVSR